MRVDIISKEYPPAIYGGAGVHVAELVRALRARADLEVMVRCFGAPRDEKDTFAYADLTELATANAALQTMGVDLAMAQDTVGADLVHSHTWYANFAGHVGGLLGGVPHVVSAHSLEPMRPWKAEQLGGGYAVSSFVERTAYEGAAAVIAVSAGMKADIERSYPGIDPSRIHVVHNGIDAHMWSPNLGADARAFVQSQGVDPDRPTIIFVGRITRQKGLPYFLQAIEQLPPEVQVVLCAGAADTPEILREVTDRIAQLRATRDGIVWIDEMLPRNQVTALLSHATVFVCPSVYEPLGIVNLEAMACGVPVVGTATGGIPEVVADGETGWLVPIDQLTDGTGTPTNPEHFVNDLAARLIEATSDPARARALGEAGRERAIREFSWESIAERTVSVYQQAIETYGR